MPKITGTRGRSKVAVMGLLERHGKGEISRVRTKVTQKVKRGPLHKNIRENV
jgi:hypothetical protein